LDAKLGPRYADLDLAMTLGGLDYTCICEPQSRIVLSARPLDQSGSWSDGRSAETLFWKHAPNARRGAYALHALSLAAEFLAAAPRPGRMLEFLGRISVLGSVALGGGGRGSTSNASAGGEAVRRRDAASLHPERDVRPARNAVQSY
jgi:hypothetical protein